MSISIDISFSQAPIMGAAFQKLSNYLGVFRLFVFFHYIQNGYGMLHSMPNTVLLCS